mmetsp:Transcript_11323/g.32529  ORF Transcript_11323/g.32529 Transcript_11323/m.32529 type:complete len:505 (+) Transcript_11323:101-1615(+)
MRIRPRRMTGTTNRRRPCGDWKIATASALVLLVADSGAEMADVRVATALPTQEYGYDCSFPVLSTDLSECPIDLGDKADLYRQYMDGCERAYGKETCNSEEEARMEKNARQPSSLLNFTETGFLKMRAPDSVLHLINDFWERNKDKAEEEYWPEGEIHTNHWDIPTDFVSVANDEFEGGGDELVDAISHAAQTTIEQWTGMKQEATSVYGVRIYRDGAILNPHCDRMPLISSAIVNVAQDVDEDWPIEVYTHGGQAVNVSMEPGDMVLYESGTVIHGRPFPLKGRFYANIFIHFEPIGFFDGRPFINKDDPELPPYVKADSVEAKYQYEYFLDGREVPSDFDSAVHLAAGNGDIEALQAIAQEDTESLRLRDEATGWEPIHEAARRGQLDSIKFLLQDEYKDIVDMDSRTHYGEGLSALTIAMKHNGPDHQVVKFLEELGAIAHFWYPNDREFFDTLEENIAKADGEEDEYEYDNEYEYTDEENEHEYTDEDEEKEHEEDDDEL